MEEHTDIIWFDTLESTNSEARRRFSDLDNLSVIAASSQSAGRGQGAHVWCSEPGANLTFTVVLKFGPDGGLRPLAASDSVEELKKLHGFIAQCAEKTDTDEGRRYLDDIFNKYMFRLS